MSKESWLDRIIRQAKNYEVPLLREEGFFGVEYSHAFGVKLLANLDDLKTVSPKEFFIRFSQLEPERYTYDFEKGVHVVVFVDTPKPIKPVTNNDAANAIFAARGENLGGGEI
jgi:hypothetical protein